MNYASYVISEWFSARQSASIIGADIFFFAVGLLLALKLGTKKTPVYLMVSAAVVYFFCSVMVITNEEYLGAIFPEVIGAMAFMMFVGNIVGYIIRLTRKPKPAEDIEPKNAKTASKKKKKRKKKK